MKKQLKANRAGNGKRHTENVFSLRSYGDWRAAAKTVKWMSKHGVKKNDALINHFHFFHCKRKRWHRFKLLNREMKLLPRFLSVCFRKECSPLPKWPRWRQKNALHFQLKWSRGALSVVDKRENWKNTKKKQLPSMRKRKLKWNFMLP